MESRLRSDRKRERRRVGREKEALCIILETNRSRSNGEHWRRRWWRRAGTGRSVRLNNERRRGWVALAGLLVAMIGITHHHILIILRF